MHVTADLVTTIQIKIIWSNRGDKKAYAFKGKVHPKGDTQLCQSGLFRQSNTGHLFGILCFNLWNEKKLPCFF
jgi:hypothetical protein